MAEYKLSGGDALARAVEKLYENGGSEYHFEPMNLMDREGKPVGTVKAGDGVIFCCRRGEREVELTDAFTDPAFKGFAREKIDPLDFVILTMYHEKYTYLPIAFAPAKVQKTLAEVLSENKKTQMHLAESEKYAHVTFFFNGGNQKPFEGEDDFRIQSPKGVPFETVPELKLPEVAQKLEEGIDHGYDFIVTNFANGDVIGHTSSDTAKPIACEAISKYVGKTVAYAREKGYTVLVTADHGNIEILHTPDGKPHVSHTTNLVACIALGEGTEKLKEHGKLCDVAPTILSAMGIEQPAEMTGEPLFRFANKGKVLLLICDGWGLDAPTENNPIFTADTPAWDALLKEYPYAELEASGPAVGLAEGKTGNSEAGHINLGSGRIVLQDDVRLDGAMKDGSFAHNPVFLETIKGVKERGTALHLFALLTKKSSHGSIDYPLALVDMAHEAGLEKVYVHIIFDGRSTQPGSAPALLREFGETIEKKGTGLVVSGVGRGVALDRDQNWAKIERTYNSLVNGTGAPYTEA
ncbi:MAG: phosphoglycerate mutase (2,3-diphosphoglycerate-independent) [Clostridia bacterium]|nr:phosphoglycerate mutase (2,3-diphosphoglycerate-independent) [Clostridia bacterium]MBR3178236.1 phosphoglycerate mutase (2,3-diphosphoglycerate-independent) [Clostridia bacterium]